MIAPKMMMRRIGWFSGGAGALAALIASAAPALADLYSLEGRFECLDHPHAVCGDPRPIAPRVSVQPPAPQSSESAPALSWPSFRPIAAPAALRPLDPITAIAHRVQAGHPSAADLARLHQAAMRGNARAIELLAWCALEGVGTKRDPVKAYLLYGTAAVAAVPHARANQAAIWENILSSDQRQSLLDLANEGVALAQPPR